ncbi:MAG TPA: molybdopterin-binding protein [Geodermatophilus sp.]|nr:molybdopterin-binding protein [Geodermatophilus sp.]
MAELEILLQEALVGGADVILTTGGTGLSPTDVTPEATRAVLEREAPGIADAVRRSGEATVPTSVLSRGVAGTAGRTLIVNLPGSTGGTTGSWSGWPSTGRAVDHGVLAADTRRHAAERGKEPMINADRAPPGGRCARCGCRRCSRRRGGSRPG